MKYLSRQCRIARLIHFKNLKIALIVLLSISSKLLIAQEKGDQLFDNSFLHRIDLDAEGLEVILDWTLGTYEGPVQLKIDGTLVDSIAIRRKGFTSNEFNNTNPPFKINIDGFIESQEFDGLDIFNLHNHFTDVYFQKNALSYSLYRRAGVPAPRTSFAEVYINNTFIDIYTITEDIDRTFLNQNFASKNGSLYKGIEFPVDGVAVNKGTIDAFDAYSNNITPENWGTYADLHNFLRVIIVDDMISTDDSGQNDYMYFEPKSEKMYFITWDHNFSYGMDISTLDTNYILNPKIPFFDIEKSSEYIQSPAVRPLYLETACVLTSYLLDSNFVSNTAHHNYNILSTNGHGLTIIEPSALIDELSAVRSAYAEALEALGYSNCNQLPNPVDSAVLVINEFVADSDEFGVQEPDGGTPDWIELFNNSNTDIVLNERYYVSDDKDFLKKWHFEEAVIIPANGYLILWADRDVHQTGIHTNFKLKSSGEDLYITYEDLTILQAVSYGQQELNKAYARVPNGIGDFVIQDHTFDASNETITSIPNTQMHLPSVRLFPNPTSGRFRIHGLDNLNEYDIKVYNALAQEVSVARLSSGEIDLGLHASGIYYIIIKNRDQEFMSTIIHR